MLEPGSDEFATHPKVLRAGTFAAGLYTRLVGYCRMHDTGGYVPAHALPFLTGGDRAVCVELGLVAPADLDERLLARLEGAKLITRDVPEASPDQRPPSVPSDAQASQIVLGWHIAGWSDGLSSSEKTKARKARHRERKRSADRPRASPEASPQPSPDQRPPSVPRASPTLSLSPPPSPPSHTLPSDSPSLSLSLGSTQTRGGTHEHARIAKSPSEPPPELEPDVEAPEAGSPEARRQRYAKAYADGIVSVTGRRFALSPRERGELAELLPIFAVDAAGRALRLAALDAWLRERAAAFARAVEGDEARFTGSLNPAAFARFLRAPAAPQTSERPAPRGRPEDVHRQRGWSQTDAERDAQHERQVRLRLERLPAAERPAEEARIRALYQAEKAKHAARTPAPEAP